MFLQDYSESFDSDLFVEDHFAPDKKRQNKDLVTQVLKEGKVLVTGK